MIFCGFVYSECIYFTAYNFTDSFSGLSGAVGSMCVWLCFQRIVFEQANLLPLFSSP